jgi:hypothetical protein
VISYPELNELSRDFPSKVFQLSRNLAFPGVSSFTGINQSFFSTPRDFLKYSNSSTALNPQIIPKTFQIVNPKNPSKKAIPQNPQK